MNQDQLSSKAWVHLGVLTTLLLGNVWWIQSPLTSSRPTGSQSQQLVDTSYHVVKPHSRLWQDPLEPLFDNVKSDANKGNSLNEVTECKKRHQLFCADFNRMCANTNKKEHGEERVLVIGMMVPGGPFEDRAERRQRIRVSLASGMAAGGYAPDDSEHLNSFPFNPNNRSTLPPEAPLFHAPYEWFSVLSEDERRNRSFPSKYSKILVFWLADDHFAESPIKLLKQFQNNVYTAMDSASCAEKSDKHSIKKDTPWALMSEAMALVVNAMTTVTPSSPLTKHKGTRVQHGGELSPSKKTAIDFAVVGPWSSTTLKNMLHEAQTDQKKGENQPEYTKIQPSNMSFYNVFATAPPSLLYPKNSNEETLSISDIVEADNRVINTINNKFCKIWKSDGDVFHYTTCPDSGLAQVLSEELKRRGVDFQNDQIAFLAENDTVYGRLLPKTFRRVFWTRDSKVDNLERFTYLRGLDGSVPKDSSKNELLAQTASPSLGVNTRTSIETRFMPTRKTNRPEGNNQFDYLIRLGDDMKQMEQSKGKKFKVIGILGSDIYDKLLILQTFKPLFPNAIFFTTDLDASFAHPQELEWTKNLLVASTHGLSLHHYYQCGIPPFRFSYQTAAFQAILAIVTKPKKDPNLTDNDVHDALSQQSSPRLFEIGWYQAYDLSDKAEKNTKTRPVKKVGPESEVANRWDANADIHPVIPTYLNQLMMNTIFFVLGILPLLFVTLFILNWHRKVLLVLSFIYQWLCPPFCKKFFNKLLNKLPKKLTKVLGSPKKSPKRKHQWTLFTIIHGLIIVAVVLGFVLYDYLSPTGEIWGWGTGISAWPSTVLRLLALIVSIILFCVVDHKLTQVLKELSSRFKLKELNTDLPFSFLKIVAALPALCAIFKKTTDDKGNQGKVPLKIDTLWDNLRKEIVPRCVLDITIWAITSFGILYLLACNGNGHFPYRSSISYWMGAIIWGSAWTVTIMLVLLTFFITRTCSRFIKEMMKGSVTWPETHIILPNQPEEAKSVLQGFSDRWGIKDSQSFTNLVDVYFVATWAGKISGLVLYPIASLILLFIAESSYFDYYGYNPYRYVVLGFMGLLIFAPAVQLRSAASKLRFQKVQRQRAYLEFHQKTNNEAVRRRIENAINETESLKEGAFEPFWEHPFMQAILFLLGGISLPAFFTLLSRPF